MLSCGTNSLGVQSFHTWEPDAMVCPGDTLIYVEMLDNSIAAQTGYEVSSLAATTTPPPPALAAGPSWLQPRFWQAWQGGLQQWWQANTQDQSQRVAMLCAIAVVLLGAVGTLLYRLNYPGVSVLDAFHTSASLLLGGYGDVFGGVKIADPIPNWLKLFSLGMALAGTALVGVLYALLTGVLLSSRFQFMAQRPRSPEQGHIVLIGLGRMGLRVAAFLQELKHPLIGIGRTELATNVLPTMPMVVGDVADALTRVNLATAKSVIVVTDDEMVNLEVGLMAHAANPTAGLVIRMDDQLFSDNLGQLLPYAKVICTSALAAAAFAGAAFGENILNLFHLDQQTVLVTEYHIEVHDTLQGLLLSEVAYGYDVVPILYEAATEKSLRWMPSDDLRLHGGDRLVVLATIEGLQRIERGELIPRTWQVWVEKASTPESTFSGATVITRISGCNLQVSRRIMEQLPAALPTLLYKHQARRLVRELGKAQVSAQCIDPG